MMVAVPPCSRCSSQYGNVTLHGEPVCALCAADALDATTVDVDGEAGLLHEVPSPIRKRTTSGKQRDARRSRAERAAVARLKLLHLPEYEALYADELHREGLKPPEGASFAVHLRKLSGKRFRALTERVAHG